MTILIRLLSYDETDAGAVWPEGYLNLANSLGLTDGVSLAYSAPITRARPPSSLSTPCGARRPPAAPTTRPWAPL